MDAQISNGIWKEPPNQLSAPVNDQFGMRHALMRPNGYLTRTIKLAVKGKGR